MGSSSESECGGTRLIIAVPDKEEAIRTEYQLFLDRAAAEGWGELRVRFGFAWGIGPDRTGKREETLNVETLAEMVLAAESRNEGRIGEDDLYITPAATGVEHHFCHEADIHLTGPEDSVYLKSEARRFASLGWAVYDTLKTAGEMDFRKVSRFKLQEGSS